MYVRCPRCGHCGDFDYCLNCELRGRVAPKVVRTPEPDQPLFFELKDGGLETWADEPRPLPPMRRGRVVSDGFVQVVRLDG